MQPVNSPGALLIALGALAALLFVIGRRFRLSNRTLAILAAAALLIVGIGWNFGPDFGQFTLLGPSSVGVFYAAEPGAAFITYLVLFMGLVVTLFNAEYMNKESRQDAFYPLFLLMLVGIIGMLWAKNLLILYLFSELMNICAYALVAFRRKNTAAIEAGFKYLMMSSVAAVIILLGIGLLFYTEGSILLTAIQIGENLLSQLGAVLIVSGFCLKCAMVPVHTWLPDAHGKAPSSVSALLSGVLVQSAFYVMVRLGLSIGISPTFLGNVLLVLSALNIIVGNLMGIIQVNLKRMLGYSTIAQMGYIALAFAIGLRNESALAFQSGLFIILSHALTKGLAFLGAGIFYFYDDVNESEQIKSLIGHPIFTHLALIVAVLNLSAIPPFPGFTGKWTTLTSLFAANDPLAFWITLIFLVGSLVSFGYYLPLLTTLSSRFRNPGRAAEAEKPLRKISPWMKLPSTLLVILTFLMMIFPQQVLDSTHQAAYYLLEFLK